ncbi:MAG TPA: hypothetical protein VFA18_06580 [Gemmataceae bacterium]|nr:hypothetical protein [Gemmataceae bacterium]
MTDTLAFILLLPPVLALSLFLIFLCVAADDQEWSETYWQELDTGFVPPAVWSPLRQLLCAPRDGATLGWRRPRGRGVSAN